MTLARSFQCSEAGHHPPRTGEARLESLVLRTFEQPLRGSDGRSYVAKVCGRSTSGDRWEGWVEFIPEGGTPILRSGRETTQPARRFIEEWAEGLRLVFLEGSLERALAMQAPRPRVPTTPSAEMPHFAGPSPDPIPSRQVPPDDAAVNPVLYFRRGEGELRKKLAELSPAELRTVAKAYGLDGDGKLDVDTFSARALVELIVLGVSRRAY